MGWFCATLTILFIALKLTNEIAWSWWLILLPLYGWFILVLLLVLLAFAIEMGYLK